MISFRLGENRMNRALPFAKFVVFALALLCLIALPSLMFAQTSVTGEIAGTVADPSGAVVSGATVTARSASTDVTQTATTSDSGAFRFVFVKPDTYKMTVGHAGFRSASQTIVVSVGAVAIANVKLEVGSASETVEVSAAPPVLETENANLTTTYNATQVQNLPNGGNHINA